MADISQLKYAPTHEWVRLSGNIATVGISDHAQKEISDVVFVELPKPGRDVKQKESAMIVESVKAAFDIYAPISGKIVKVNDKLKENPELVNKSPYSDGWLFEIEVSNLQEMSTLMNEADYNSTKDAHH